MGSSGGRAPLGVALRRALNCKRLGPESVPMFCIWHLIDGYWNHGTYSMQAGAAPIVCSHTLQVVVSIECAVLPLLGT
jgi:hypothetical protein